MSHSRDRRTKRQQAKKARDSARLAYNKINFILDKMSTSSSTAKSPLPQFVCQSCGTFLTQDPSLETLDDQITKPISGKNKYSHFYFT